MGRTPKKVQGVYERIKGSGVWFARYRINGKLVRKSFGTDRGAAVAWVDTAKLIRRTGTGIVPISATVPLRTHAEVQTIGMTTLISELCDDALRFSKRHHRDTINPTTRIEAIRARFGQRTADSITPDEIEIWLEGLYSERGRTENVPIALRQKCSPGTLNRYKSTFSLLYREGKRLKKVSTNPAKEVVAKRVSEGVLRYLLPDEETRLRAVIQKRFPDHMHELDIALNTGMRKGEMYGLRWTEVDLSSRTVMLNITKNGRPRTVHLNDDALAAMCSLKAIAKGDFVFNISENRTWWAFALRDAKINDFRFHDLRHTFCSRLCQAGVNLRVVQEAAGHQSIAMTTRYAHLDHTTMREALAVLNRTKDQRRAA